MFQQVNTQKVTSRSSRVLLLIVSIMAIALFAGCGSTKVYNNDKTVVYSGAVYNISKVKQINRKITAKLSDSETVSLRGADRKQVEAYLKEHDSIYVRMAFGLDDQEMLYRASSVSKWSEYSNMLKSFDKAGNQITSLMGDKKKMQLKLK
jgi:hypothetical protein